MDRMEMRRRRLAIVERRYVTRGTPSRCADAPADRQGMTRLPDALTKLWEEAQCWPGRGSPPVGPAKGKWPGCYTFRVKSSCMPETADQVVIPDRAFFRPRTWQLARSSETMPSCGLGKRSSGLGVQRARVAAAECIAAWMSSRCCASSTCCWSMGWRRSPVYGASSTRKANHRSNGIPVETDAAHDGCDEGSHRCGGQGLRSLLTLLDTPLAPGATAEDVSLS